MHRAALREVRPELSCNGWRRTGHSSRGSSGRWRVTVLYGEGFKVRMDESKVRV